MRLVSELRVTAALSVTLLPLASVETQSPLRAASDWCPSTVGRSLTCTRMLSSMRATEFDDELDAAAAASLKLLLRSEKSPLRCPARGENSPVLRIAAERAGVPVAPYGNDAIDVGDSRPSCCEAMDAREDA